MDTYEEFHDTLSAWLAAHQVPEHLHRRLYEKIVNGVFDSGSRFALARWRRVDAVLDSDAEEQVDAGGDGAGGDAAIPTAALSYPGYYLVATQDLPAEGDVWLVDHCCTFQLPALRDELLCNEVLRTRLETITRQEPEPPSPFAEASAEGNESRVDRLMAGLWPYVGSYDLMNPRNDDVQPHYWFVPDEVGSALNVTFDDEEVNVKLVTLPFYFALQQCVYSFFWVTAPVEAGTVLARHPHHRFEPHCGEVVSRVLYESWSGEPPKAEVIERCREAWQNHYREQAHISALRNVQNQLTRAATIALEQQQRSVTEPTYPPLQPMVSSGGGDGSDGQSRPEKLTVYVSHHGVASALSASGAFQGESAPFQTVSLPSEAAVVWMTNHVFRSMADFGHARFVVYLPEHEQLTSPRDLAALEQRTVGKTPLLLERLDGVSQLCELVGSAVEEGGVGYGYAGCVWELVDQDGRRVWGPVALHNWPRVREVLRVAETGPLCLVRAIDAEALTLSPGSRMLLHVPLIVRSWRSSETGLEAYIHQCTWASFLPAFGPVATAAESACECYPGAWVEGQLAALTGRVGIWKTEVIPVLSHTLRDVLAAVVPMQGVEHRRLGAVLGVQLQLVMSGDRTSPVMPVLVGFSEHLNYNVVLRQCPSFFADALNTLCFQSETNMIRL
ncbi:putative tubulin tyrosine ligase [Leptomonas seymouri]|uniref:Putative tubulin tyrosine ligase n=1 Tax=Leptomonas seymouri TaxID=5684 RepID=A0A0N1I2T1_LEPSE|nr:putative tubulin tyrosine ligase [Leptomonas seymouri]|eukprot:KPI89861.1 putative tubulin tyrosine ligase [Leptomonas seymouri]